MRGASALISITDAMLTKKLLDDDLVGVVGDVFEGWEHNASAEDLMDAELS